MATFLEISKRVEKINMNNIYKIVFSEKNIQSWSLGAIQNRLYDIGVDGVGNKLKTDNAGSGFYSERTKDIKNLEGKKFSNVTLEDTGAFYHSMKFNLNLYGFDIDANFLKEHGHIYKNFTESYANKADFEDKILKLTVKEFDYIMQTFAIPKIKQEIKKQI